MDTEFKKIWRIMVAITAGIFMIMFTIFYFSPKDYSGRDLFRESIKNKAVKNRVDRIYFDRDNHGAAYAVYQNDSIELFGVDWGERVLKGDSLIKPKGSLQMKVVKPTGEKFILDFEESTTNL